MAPTTATTLAAACLLATAAALQLPSGGLARVARPAAAAAHRGAATAALASALLAGQFAAGAAPALAIERGDAALASGLERYARAGTPAEARDALEAVLDAVDVPKDQQFRDDEGMSFSSVPLVADATKRDAAVKLKARRGDEKLYAEESSRFAYQVVKRQLDPCVTPLRVLPPPPPPPLDSRARSPSQGTARPSCPSGSPSARSSAGPCTSPTSGSSATRRASSRSRTPPPPPSSAGRLPSGF